MRSVAFCHCRRRVLPHWLWQRLDWARPWWRSARFPTNLAKESQWEEEKGWRNEVNSAEDADADAEDTFSDWPTAFPNSTLPGHGIVTAASWCFLVRNNCSNFPLWKICYATKGSRKLLFSRTHKNKVLYAVANKDGLVNSLKDNVHTGKKLKYCFLLRRLTC